MFGTTGSLNFPMAYDFDHEVPARTTKRKCWGSYTKLEKCLWITLGIILSLLIGLAIATTIIGVQFAELKHKAIELGFTSNESHPYPGFNQCLESERVLTAAKIKNSMDETIHPCYDFYSFACGGWIKKNPVPLSAGRWGQFDLMRDELAERIREILEENPFDEESNDTSSKYPEPLLSAQQFYEVCKAQDMNDSISIEDFTAYIDIVYQIQNISTDISSLGTILGILRREVAGDYLFQLFVALNETNTTNHIIYLDQPNLGIEKEFLLDNTHNGNNFREAYHSLITSVWSVVFPLEAPQASTIATEILQLEIALANHSMSQHDRRNKSELYNPMTYDELYNLTRNVAQPGKSINWKSYFEQVFKILLLDHEYFEGSSSSKENNSIIIDNDNANDNEINNNNNTYYHYNRITDYYNSSGLGLHLNHILQFNFTNITYVVRDVPYFKSLGTTLNRFRIVTLVDYLKWRVLFDLGKEVNAELRRIFYLFEQKTNGVILPLPLWKECVDRTNYYFGMAVSYRYVQKYFDETTLYKAKTLVSDILSIFMESLRQAKWLDPSTKRKAIAKARKMKIFIGYPDWLLKNETKLDEYYHGLDFSSPENHFYNMIDLAKWQNKKNLGYITKKKPEDEWITDPTIINAFYSPLYNSINFPAGILQSPFYMNPLESLNYGAMGAIIGHEITHGFDDRGSQNDADGNLHNWWDEPTLKNYFEKSACFVEQYSNYTVPEINMTINGRNTLSENIADNGGLRHAYLAYKRYEMNTELKQKLLPGLTNFNSDQLFFISYAQIMCETETQANLVGQIYAADHTPSKYRLKGVLANSNEFASTWGCPKPSLNSTCELW